MVRNIQVLRAIAALAVVWHHLQTQMNLHMGTPHLGYVGRAGVDVFFVISGFIMFHTTQAGDRTTLAFWKDRLIRIAPMYWLATLFAAAIFWLGIHPGDVKALSATDVVEDLLFVPHFRADADTYPVLDVGWTLDFEMFFYFLFGLTFFLKSQAQALGALVLIFVAGALLDHFHAPLPHAAETYFQPLTLEFAAGGALALLYRREFLLPARAHRLAGLALLAAGLALLAWNGLKDGEFVSWNFELRAQTFGVPATMIVAGALMLELGGLAARSSFLMLLGAASYSIYLVHHIVVQYLARAGAVLLPDASAPVLIAAGAAMFVVAASVGVAAHLWIEKPITRMLKRPRGNRTAVPA